MARIAGIELPNDKRVEISLQYVYGIGQTRSLRIVKEAQIDRQLRMKDLNDEQIAKIRSIIEENYRIEGDLRSEVLMNIKRLKDIACYRGIRHRMGLPLRGQRTKTNARTRKGKRVAIANKKKAPGK